MDTKEDAELLEDRSQEVQPPSPYVVLKNMSEEMVGEAPQTTQPMPPAHRRSQSEVINPGHMRSSGFQKLKTQMQKAWRWGSNSREQDYNFNPEVLTNQKRQWYQLHSKTLVLLSFFPIFSLYFCCLKLYLCSLFKAICICQSFVRHMCSHFAELFSISFVLNYLSNCLMCIHRVVICNKS